jgi:hypothetical protein
MTLTMLWDLQVDGNSKCLVGVVVNRFTNRTYYIESLHNDIPSLVS